MSGYGTNLTCRGGLTMSVHRGRPEVTGPLRNDAFDPGCVKTCTSRECAELFSLFSSFDGDCQSGSFLIQRNRDKLSTPKLGVGVFTQPGPKADIPS